MSGLKVANLSPIVRQFLQRTTLYTSIEGMTWKGSLETSFQKLGIVEIVFCNPNTSPITRYCEGFYCRKNFAYIFVNIKCFFYIKLYRSIILLLNIYSFEICFNSFKASISRITSFMEQNLSIAHPLKSLHRCVYSARQAGND